MRLLLLHPPLLSAVVWCHLNRLLVAAGHEVSVPDLRPRRHSDWWQRAADVAVGAMPQADVVLAHSGAGALAPVVLGRLPSAGAVVLIDAVLPAASGATAASAQARRAVHALAVDGLLPPWTSWWGDEELAVLVPDEQDRAALVVGAPQLGEAFFDVAVPAPRGWEPAVRGYLQLSPAYAEAAAQAAGRGWRVRYVPGQHLDVLSRPLAVADAVLDLLAAGPSAAPGP